MVITSLTNDKIKNVNKLKLKKYRDLNKKFIVEGDHLVSEAYKSGYLTEIFATEDALITYDDIPVILVSNEVMNKLTDQVTGTNIIGICNYINNDNFLYNKNLIILDGLQDPGNVGTIIRSSAAFNYNILLGDNTVDIYNSKTIRSTEGMIFYVNFIKENVCNFINNNKDKYIFYVADMDKGFEAKEVESSNLNCAIIMGNEGNGISDDVNNLNLNYVHIKQSDSCESLNVGIAAGILMYELGDKHGR